MNYLISDICSLCQIDIINHHHKKPEFAVFGFGVRMTVCEPHLKDSKEMAGCPNITVRLGDKTKITDKEIHDIERSLFNIKHSVRNKKSSSKI